VKEPAVWLNAWAHKIPENSNIRVGLIHAPLSEQITVYLYRWLSCRRRLYF
jgi:hypothetical protein